MAIYRQLSLQDAANLQPFIEGSIEGILLQPYPVGYAGDATLRGGRRMDNVVKGEL
jgi:hypothetical protein